jgi:Flp pilus assembly protein TadB
MKLEQIIILSVAVALFIIGIHQSFLYGVMASYWIFMLVAALLFYYKLRSSRNQQAFKDTSSAEKSKKSVKPRPRS